MSRRWTHLRRRRRGLCHKKSRTRKSAFVLEVKSRTLEAKGHATKLESVQAKLLWLTKSQAQLIDGITGRCIVEVFG